MHESNDKDFTVHFYMPLSETGKSFFHLIFGLDRLHPRTTRVLTPEKYNRQRNIRIHFDP